MAVMLSIKLSRGLFFLYTLNESKSGVNGRKTCWSLNTSWQRGQRGRRSSRHTMVRKNCCLYYSCFVTDFLKTQCTGLHQLIPPCRVGIDGLDEIVQATEVNWVRLTSCRQWSTWRHFTWARASKPCRHSRRWNQSWQRTTLLDNLAHCMAWYRRHLEDVSEILPFDTMPR